MSRFALESDEHLHRHAALGRRVLPVRIDEHVIFARHIAAHVRND